MYFGLILSRKVLDYKMKDGRLERVIEKRRLE